MAFLSPSLSSRALHPPCRRMEVKWFVARNSKVHVVDTDCGKLGNFEVFLGREVPGALRPWTAGRWSPARKKRLSKLRVRDR